VEVWKAGEPDSDGKCVVYWMQRAQRAIDNPALDLAVTLGNELRKPCQCSPLLLSCRGHPRYCGGCEAARRRIRVAEISPS
jgi:hypothetical protein